MIDTEKIIKLYPMTLVQELCAEYEKMRKIPDILTKLDEIEGKIEEIRSDIHDMRGQILDEM